MRKKAGTQIVLQTGDLSTKHMGFNTEDNI